MKHIFILNSFSLKEETDILKEKITKVCTKKKIDFKIECNSINESTEDILKKYQRTKYIIIPVGGDGTINRVLNSIVGTKNILGYIPHGTGNDFYRTNKELLKDKINEIDLIKINDKYFINVACFGIDADIGNNNEIIHSKFIPKKQRYNFSLIYHFLKYKARKMKLTINNKIIDDYFSTIAVCNARYYGGGYKISPNSSLTDSLLDVYIIRKTNKINMARLILKMKDSSHIHSPKVEIVKTKELEIESDKEISSNVDGEILSSNKFYIKLIPKGTRIYYNEELIKELL